MPARVGGAEGSECTRCYQAFTASRLDVFCAHREVPLGVPTCGCNCSCSAAQANNTNTQFNPTHQFLERPNHHVWWAWGTTSLCGLGTAWPTNRLVFLEAGSCPVLCNTHMSKPMGTPGSCWWNCTPHYRLEALPCLVHATRHMLCAGGGAPQTTVKNAPQPDYVHMSSAKRAAPRRSNNPASSASTVAVTT